MPQLERLWDDRNRTVVAIASGTSVTLIALVDWWTKPYVSLGFLYLFPIILMASILPRFALASVAVGCAVLAEVFSALEPSPVRLSFEAVALAGSGLFISELIRNRRLTITNQARLEALVETSPAGIVTVDQRGLIELANRAATELLVPRGGNLVGIPVAAFLPELHHALQWEEAPQFRASMQCQGHRGNGESFLADVWFSTYREGSEPKVAAIIAEVAVDLIEDDLREAAPQDGFAAPAALTERELEVLRFLVRGLANKEIAARMDLSESTVKNTLQLLFAKHNVRSRAQLVRVAIEQYRVEL